MTTTTMPWWREPTRAQWFSFSAAWLGWVLDAFDFTIFLLVMPQIAQEFGVSVTAAAGSVTLTLLVRLLGGFAAGAAADRWGRRLPLMISMVWFAVSDAAVAMAPSFTWVLVLRILFGFGMGAEWTAGTTLAMENWPARSRGIASGLLQGSWAVGYFLAAVASAYVVPAFGWRGLFWLAAVPALLVLPIRIWVPESPDFQAGKKQDSGALRDLLAPGLLRKIFWGSGGMALGFGVYYAMSALYPTMLQKELGLGVHEVAFNIGLFNAGMLVGAVIIGMIANRYGVLWAIVVPAALTLPALPLYLGYWPGLVSVGAFVGAALGVGFCGIVPMFLTGLFPPEVRARAVGLVYHIGAFGAAFVPTASAALAEQAGISLALSIGIFAGVSELALVVLMLAKRGELLGTSTAVAGAVREAA